MPDTGEPRGQEDEARHRALLDRYKLALAEGRVTVWEWDAATDLIVGEDHTLSDRFGFVPRHAQSVAQWFAAVHPDDHERVLTQWTAIIEGMADSAELECRVVSDDGRVWWHHTHYLVSKREDGRVRRIVGVSSDITERKRAEEALHASEARYRTLFGRYKLASTSGRVGVWEWDAETDALVSEDVELADMLGFDPTQRQTGARWREAIHPEDRDRVLAVWTSLLEGPSGEAESEYRVVSDDGRVWWQHTRYIGSERVAGRVRRVVGVTSDITERREAEEALRLSEERYGSLFELNAIAAGELDLSDGHFLRVNDAYCQMLGYSREELLGLSFADISHPDEQEENRLVFGHLLRGEIADARLEKRYVRKDGRVIWVQLAITLIQDSAGIPISELALALDITERKRAEQEIQHLAARLATAQDEERRRIAQELHDQTAQALVASILTLTALLDTHDELNEEGRTLVRESLTLERQVLEELRTLSYVLHPPLLDEVGLVAALGWYVDGFSKRSSIAVELIMPPDLERLLPEVESAFFRVVQESLTNIHRHAESNRASIRLAREDGHIVLEVKDQGHGMAAEASRASEDVTVLGVGITGMRQRMHQLGGQLDLRSSSDGTTVTAIVPSNGHCQRSSPTRSSGKASE